MISFNIPLNVGTVQFVQQDIDAYKICGDGITKMCIKDWKSDLRLTKCC